MNAFARIIARAPRMRARRAKAVGCKFSISSLPYFISPFVEPPLLGPKTGRPDKREFRDPQNWRKSFQAVMASLADQKLGATILAGCGSGNLILHDQG